MAGSRQERRREERLEDEAKPSAKKSPRSKTVYILVAAAIIALFAFGVANSMNAQKSGPYNPVASGPQIDVGEQSSGNPDAALTITEFSDFECPFCGKFFANTYPLIRADYVDTGKVRLVYKQFPLTNTHKQSFGAAAASLCAADQGKFWEYHDALFINQPRFGRANLEAYASSLGLDMARFNKCLDDGATVDQVKREMSEGNAAGVDGTPFFIIGNQRISGAQPIEAFRIAIESGLSDAG